jgi:6,7-dimethyl-8-ribityllumazine synthase
VRPGSSASSSAPPPSAGGYRFALVVSRFNPEVTGSLRGAAEALLSSAGADVVEVFDVPGAYELPQAARCLAETARFDAVVCLGCVIRGETPHFDYISSAVAHGIMEAAGETGVPIAFGVLTTDTDAQARARAGGGDDNKGREAALAALEMAILYRKLGRPPARAGAGRPFGFEPAGRPGVS